MRAGIDQQARHVFAKSRGLLGRAGGALLDILRTVHGTDAGVHDQFAAFDARPCAERHLTAALQGGEQSALGDDGGARFRVIQRAQDFGGLGILQPALDGNGALPHRRHANVGREHFADALAPAETIESGFG